MRHVLLATCVAVTLVVVPKAAVAQPDHHANSPKAEFHLSSPMTVGTTVLQVGDYKFQCVRIGGVDFLIVTDVADGKEVARVPCKPEELVERPKISEMRTVPIANGRALAAVRIRGEKIAHRVVGG